MKEFNTYDTPFGYLAVASRLADAGTITILIKLS